MRLIPPVWRTAWYEEGLSERFVQEMTRLEKSVVKELGTSAEWVEQLVIELGQLTQNMIHLEGELPRPHQLKLALERALKLAALSAHLMAALDRAVDHGPSVLRYSEEGESRSLGTATGELSIASHPTPALNPQPMASVRTGEPTPALQPAAQNSQPPATSPVLRASPQVQVGLKRQSGAEPRAVMASAREPQKPSPLMSNLMDISQPMIEDSASPIREMILALSRRGLSRSEIEVITEQPRHIIEAVLQHG